MQYKRYALDIVTSVVPNLIAFDCYAVQALDNRVGMLNYIDYSYSKSKGATKKGDVFASSINMGKSDPWYTADLVKDEPIGTGDGSKVKFTGTFPWNPVILNSLIVKVEDGDTFYYDANSGTFVTNGTGTLTANTLSPDGTFDLTFGTAPASTKAVTVTYRFNNEDVRSDGYDWDGNATDANPGTQQAGFTNVPEIQLDIKSIPITAKARTLRSFWSFDAAYELQKEYGQDIETLLATQSTGEIAHEIDKSHCQRIQKCM